MDLRLMAVHAHPDDESSKGTATLLKYVSEGVDVMVVTCTDGGDGSILNPHMQNGRDFPYPYLGKYWDADEVSANMTEVRQAEMANAVKLLGVRNEWLGFKDSGYNVGIPGKHAIPGSFATVPVEEAARKLVAAIRRFKPHVLISYDENGGYPHLDHIMSHKITVHAYQTVGDPDQYPDAGAPWQPAKLYYSRTRSEERLAALKEAMLSEGRKDINTHAEGAERPVGYTPGTRIKCDEFFSLRDEVLRMHASQIAHDDPYWFCVPNHVEARVWPTEDYELVHSHVPTTLPEPSLSVCGETPGMPGYPSWARQEPHPR